MLRRIYFLAGYYLFWLAMFTIGRTVFFIGNFSQTNRLAQEDIAGSYTHGMLMDASMAAYISVPVFIILIISLVVGRNARSVVSTYSVVVLVIVLLAIVADVFMFRVWGTRMDSGFLKYLNNPKEAMASIENLPLFWIVLFLTITFAVFWFLLRGWIKAYTKCFAPQPQRWISVVVLLLLAGSLIVPIRGGFQLAPLNQSSVYFSANNFANLSAVNPLWNFVFSLTQASGEDESQFQNMSEKEAQSLVEPLFERKVDSTKKIFSVSKPNIILITWESFTAKVINNVYKGITVTPHFNQLIKEGYYFPNHFATGDRTDKGIVALLSGYPAQPLNSIIKNPKKAGKLPTLPAILTSSGYQSAFYYGGELEFANMKAYLLASGFQRFVSISDFDKKDMNSKWGAHDGVVEARLEKDFSSVSQPFFLQWLTLSSHEPFETPEAKTIIGEDDEAKFLNSLNYTDKVVARFIDYCKAQSWWRNTVVIITGDHGHRLPTVNRSSENFRTPLLLLGGAVSPKVDSNVVSQIDLAYSILGQLGLDNSKFIWSKYIFGNAKHHWAYMAFTNGFGYIHTNGTLFFDNVGRRTIETTGSNDSLDIKRGKALQQLTMQDFYHR